MADLAVEQGVPRLDYSKPPPGYTAAVLLGEEWHIVGPGWAENFDTWKAATAAAWAHYKAHNDPPGMWIERVRPPEYAPRGTTSVWWTYYVGGGGLLCLFAKPDEVAARAAAWSWYDRRLALFALSDAAEGLAGTAAASSAWTLCLTWSDEQVAEVERWLVDSTAEMPEVLRG